MRLPRWIFGWILDENKKEKIEVKPEVEMIKPEMEEVVVKEKGIEIRIQYDGFDALRDGECLDGIKCNTLEGIREGLERSRRSVCMIFLDGSIVDIYGEMREFKNLESFDEMLTKLSTLSVGEVLRIQISTFPTEIVLREIREFNDDISTYCGF